MYFILFLLFYIPWKKIFMVFSIQFFCVKVWNNFDAQRLVKSAYYCVGMFVCYLDIFGF